MFGMVAANEGAADNIPDTGAGFGVDASIVVGDLRRSMKTQPPTINATNTIAISVRRPSRFPTRVLANSLAFISIGLNSSHRTASPPRLCFGSLFAQLDKSFQEIINLRLVAKIIAGFGVEFAANSNGDNIAKGKGILIILVVPNINDLFAPEVVSLGYQGISFVRSVAGGNIYDLLAANDARVLQPANRGQYRATRVCLVQGVAIMDR
jgi:hypothetical protein